MSQPSTCQGMHYTTSLIVGSDGSTHAHVHDLMGCTVLARNRERALTKVKAAIPDYQRWLRRNSEDVAIVLRPGVKIVEEVRTRGNIGRAGGPDPLFQCDRKTCSRRDINRCLRLLKYTRADLAGLTSDLPEEVLDWKPRSEPRSVRNAIEHIARVDIWYLSRIGADPPLQKTRMRATLELLDYARSLVNRVLPRLATEQRAKIFYPRKWSDSIWPWTATKVLHRLVSHEKQHTRYLNRILRLPGSPRKRVPTDTRNPSKSRLTRDPV